MLSEDELMLLFYLIVSLFMLLLVAFVLVYVFLHQKRVNAHHKQLQEQEMRKQYELFDAITEGEEKERKRLSEELHDGIAAKLVGLKMNMEYLALSHDENQSDHIGRLTVNMDDLVNELRELSLNLQPSFLHAKGLKATLLEITDNLNSKGDCKYQLFAEVGDNKIAAPLQLQVCRITSELLVNIHKHAQATEASVQLMVNDDVLQIIAEDNGVGMSLGSEKKGVGLVNLRNRVDYLKGKMNIDSSARGTTVIIELNTMP